MPARRPWRRSSPTGRTAVSLTSALTPKRTHDAADFADMMHYRERLARQMEDGDHRRCCDRRVGTHQADNAAADDAAVEITAECRALSALLTGRASREAMSDRARNGAAMPQHHADRDRAGYPGVVRRLSSQGTEAAECPHRRARGVRQPWAGLRPSWCSSWPPSRTGWDWSSRPTPPWSIPRIAQLARFVAGRLETKSRAAPITPVASFDRARLPAPQPASLVDLLDRRAAERPHAKAFVFVPERGGAHIHLTFAELHQTRPRRRGAPRAAHCQGRPRGAPVPAGTGFHRGVLRLPRRGRDRGAADGAAAHGCPRFQRSHHRRLLAEDRNDHQRASRRPPRCRRALPRRRL